ncbi:MAG: outer membrane beta-barrel protein [Zhengella sp.]|uniref:outer membrane beta-barrel protein n=1 Tax=Zhengella sp. TaxID=2282762 RepID=UPI001E1482C8|nr:outer membrane beta-barrel protein [Notoacmeibacter sp.]MCC0027658.1 outer membrane beta-barrel protein [Brucellaceae bacterium]
MAPLPLAAMLLAASALAVPGSAPAMAQSVQGLRGEVDEADTARSLLQGQSLADRPTALTGKRKKASPRPAVVPDPRPYIPQAEETGDSADGAGLFGTARLSPEEPRLPRIPRAPDDTGSSEDASRLRQTGEDAAGAQAQDLLGGSLRTRTDPARDEERNTRLPPDNRRTGSVDGIEPAREADPYAPLGLRVGTFTVTPTLETGMTVTDNALSSPAKETGIFSDTTLRLDAVSNWSRHEARLNGFASWRQAVSGPGESEPNLGLDGSLRLDFGADHAVKAAAGYELRREAAESPVSIPAGATRPLLHRLDASLGLEKTAGRLRYALAGEVGRDAYGDADLTGGGTLDQSDRNFTLINGRLRVGYAVSPALTPFIEAEYGRRIHDNRVDSSGYQRSADRYAVRGGLSVDLGEKLNGDIAIGYVRETLDDSRLADIDGLSVLANLNWSPERGTRVSLTGETTVEGTTTAGASGSLLQSGTIALERQIRANLTGNAQFTASMRDYAGSSGRDITLAGQLGFTWWLNRNAGLTTRLRHERLTSTLPGRDYATNSAFLGLKLQR